MKTFQLLIRRLGAVSLFAFSLHELWALPGSLDTNYHVGITTGEVGFSVAVQPDYKVIAVGTFGVMRFLRDGAVDPSFRSIPRGLAPYAGPGRGIGSVVLQPDGRILVAGSFTNAANETLPAIFRLHADGSIDPSFNLDPSVQTSGRVLALQADGKVLTDGLIRLQADGSVDPEFMAGWYHSGAEFHALAITPDGKVYYATSEGFGRVNADGSRDESFNPEPAAGPWGAIAWQRDGKVIVGQYSDGPGFKSVRRLLSDGAEDPSWTPPEVNGGDAVVYSILPQPDGKVLIGGSNLEALNGVPVANLGRLNANGTVDTNFNTGADLHYYSVEEMALAPDGRVIVAGTQLVRPDISLAPGLWRLHNDSGMQPHLTITPTAKDGLLLGLQGQPGARYRLEYREGQWGPGAWTLLTNLTLSGTQATGVDSGWKSAPARFYRAVSTP